MLRVEITLYATRLAAGEHRALVADLEQMAAARLLDEEIHAQLMLALYRSGRQADALVVYQRIGAARSPTIGPNSSQPLRDLEVAILRQDPALDVPAQSAGHSASGSIVPVPAQLPPAPAFVGRSTELASLDELLQVRASSGRP